MEVAGLAVGIVSLYNATIDIIDRVDSYKDFATGSQTTIARFNASKLKLQNWANSLGIHDGGLADPHDTRLDDPQTALVITNVLRSLEKAFDKVEYRSTSLKLPVRQRSARNDDWVINLGKIRNEVEPSRTSSKSSRLAWATGGKLKLSDDVNTFEALVDVLYGIVTPREGTAEALKDLSHTISSSLGELLEAANTIKHNSVEIWLDAPKDDDEYEKNVSLRLDGTCSWIRNTSVFAKWISEDFSSTGAKFLWVCGPAGFGKTIISAYLIEYFRTNLKSPLGYCFAPNHKNRADHLISTVRTWITQISRAGGDVLNLVDQLRQEQNDRRASSENIWTLLKQISKQTHEPCTFVLDGLDEFDNINDERPRFLAKLKDAVTSTQVRVLITSRVTVDIETELSSSASPGCQILEWRVDEEDVRSDVSLFAQAVVAEKLPRQDPTFRETLALQISDRCEGMFLWIKLQQDRIRGGKSRKALHDIVQAMPQGLYRVYDRNWEYIQDLEERDRAIDILRWLTFARRPLTVEEIAEALVVQLDDKKEAFCKDDLPDAFDDDFINGEIKGLCGSLVELRRENSDSSSANKTLHLVHASVKDYLMERLPMPYLGISSLGRLSTDAAQHLKLAAHCIRFLNCEAAWASGNATDGPSFTAYATRYWFVHLQLIKTSYDAISGLVHDFMNPYNDHFERWKQAFEVEEPAKCDGAIGGTDTSSMHYACWFGLVPTIEYLYENENTNIDTLSVQYGTPLQIVCRRGYREAFKRLMKWKADMSVEGGPYHSVLDAAARGGQSTIVKTLLKRGRERKFSDSEIQTAIEAAARRGHGKILLLLLDQVTRAPLKVSESPEEQAKTSVSLAAALRLAAEKGYVNTVRLLLDHSADPNVVDEKNVCAMSLAARENHLGVVKLLLQEGANINLSTSLGTPLHFATYNGHLDLAVELISNGADVEALDDDSMTALHEAARQGRKDVVEILMEHGANVNTGDSNGGTPLSYAVRKGHRDVVEILMEHGANVNTGDSDGDTPLFHAVHNGHTDVVSQLLQGGADVNTQDDEGLTALWYALWMNNKQRRLEVARLLIEKGAKFHANVDGVTLLMMAARKGFDDIVSLFLDHGADINATGIHGISALHAAAYKGELAIISILVSKGCNLNMKSIFGETPLNIAIRRASNEITEYLVKAGASLFVVDMYGMSCLDWLRRLRPNLEIAQQSTQESNSTPIGPDITLICRSIGGLISAIREHDRLANARLYNLARCFLILDMEDRARLVYQQAALTGLPLCECCEEDLSEVDWFNVCKVCPLCNLCCKCVEEDRKPPFVNLCRDHSFMKVVPSEAKLRPDQTEALDQWLDDLLEEFKESDTWQIANSRSKIVDFRPTLRD
ncbi:uncharacterized protein KY384_005146 [Bacidia gigantensis]|uniref:uncharacterized protein n=1 Tax=Bacidia gigantensis TaxID=2732470 RepID=UPI001D036438|nr:uncharacterized protein KY384_005146 [Bacidia gigantensis]KAG8529665.1 hypothetical protein KY384_005146 [Bacidia gigantensis]